MNKPGFISLEWFHSPSKPAEEPKKEPLPFEEMERNLKEGRLSNGLEMKTGEIEINAPEAAMFYRADRPISYPLDEFRDEFKIYDDIYRVNKSAVIKFNQDQKAFNKAMHRLASPSTSWDQLRSEILSFAQTSKKHSGGNSVCAKFKEPRGVLLGGYVNRFQNAQGTKFITDQPNTGRNTVRVHALIAMDSNAFLELINRMGKFLGTLEDIREDADVCFDMTDSPMRGFMTEIDSDQEVREILNPFIEYGMTDHDSNAGLFDILQERVGNLQKAAMLYVRLSCN